MSDEILIQEYQRTGNRELLDEVVRRNFDRVYRFVASMVTSNDSVDDLVQDVLTSVVRNIGKFHGRSRFSTWIYQITQNRVRRFLETSARNFMYLDDEQAERIEAKPWEETVDSKELMKQIDSVIAELSPALRTAILLTGVEGLTPEEAAIVENCSVANIHWRIHKARIILRRRLKEYL
ncbi:MAG: RNA polymerase sigma factor [Planctomycetaceae bacterium]|nr:RNA polymerase sigma factor [Planctomycetaceae bacterium]